MSKKKETKEERSERRRKELRLALRVFRYFLPYKWAMVVALLASAVVSGTTAGTAWLIKPALDDIFIRQDGTALLYVPLAFIVLTALKGAGRYLQNWCMHYSALHVLETMRQELFQKIITLPLHFYEESQVGALMSRVINDVGMIRQSLPAFIQIIRQVITMISLLYVVFQQNFELACWAIIVLPVAGFPLSLFSRALRRYGRKNARGERQHLQHVAGTAQRHPGHQGLRHRKAGNGALQQGKRPDHQHQLPPVLCVRAVVPGDGTHRCDRHRAGDLVWRPARSSKAT